jgi:epoxyqueuosine reductase QueG
MGIADQIKEQAHKLGALACGIASVERVSQSLPKDHWPVRLMPDAKNIVVAGCFSPRIAAIYSPESRMYGHSKVARRGGNRKKISDGITNLIEKEYGFFALETTEMYLGPFQPFMSLKLCAEEAGLGRRGMNSLINNPKYGPRLEFLIILTAMPLQPDEKLAQSPCPHQDCIAKWAKEKTTFCLEACPQCLDGEIKKGKLEWTSYQQMNCMPRAQRGNPQRFTMILEQLINEPDPQKRKSILYGSEFQYCLEAISSRSEVAAFCYECQRVCPIGRDEFQVAHQNMDIDTEFYREALPSGGPLFISESLYQDHKNYILKYSNVQQKFAKGAAVDRGKSDRELAQELGLTPKEVREIRCRARLEMVSYEDWHKADEFKDTRCQQFLKSFYRRSS